MEPKILIYINANKLLSNIGVFVIYTYIKARQRYFGDNIKISLKI